MSNKLAQNFTFGCLIRFALPSIIMMICMSLYTMVDGVFVARLVGTTALSAVNIVYPMVSLIIGAGIMLATGGSAIVAINMGQGENLRANRNFTLLVIVGVAAGVVFSILLLLFLNPVLRFLGANTAVFAYCRGYAFTLACFFPLAILQVLFQSFFVTAGRPLIGMGLIICAGLVNIALDYVFIAVLGMGIAGAALATGIGYCIPALFGLLYFALGLNPGLRFVRPKWNGRMLRHACVNGSSEMVTNLSAALITFLFNLTMMHYLGENGVAAITIVLYLEYLLIAIYLGYSIGISPVISFNYGSRNTERLKKLFKVSMRFIAVSAVIIFGVSNLMIEKFARIFVGQGSDVFNITLSGFYVYAFCFLFMGVNIFGSALFTALSNGKISALISFLRTFIFIAGGIIVWPMLFGVAGIWMAVPIGEVLSVLLTLRFFATKRRVYQYL